MPLTISLLNQLKTDHPLFLFLDSGKFLWSAREQTIHIDLRDDLCDVFTLHELSHALLNHQGYRTDIDLLKLERDAWEHAKKTLGAEYGVSINDNFIQDNLDTYRDWLHARSKCPDCDSTGIQTKSLYYRCLSCSHQWRVNEARVCALRRYSLQTK